MANPLLQLANPYLFQSIRRDGKKTQKQSQDIPHAAEAVYQRYPSMRDWGFEFIDSRPPEGAVLGPDRRKLEFYHPDEPAAYSPNPGVPTIEVFARNLRGKALEDALFGDMLHYAPFVNPDFARLRHQFSETLTPWQKGKDIIAHRRSIDEYGDDRPFDRWFDTSRLDAYLRGFLAPDQDDHWRGEGGIRYTKEQVGLMREMEKTLRRTNRDSPVSPELPRLELGLE